MVFWHFDRARIDDSKLEVGSELTGVLDHSPPRAHRAGIDAEDSSSFG